MLSCLQGAPSKSSNLLRLRRLKPRYLIGGVLTPALLRAELSC